MIGERKILKRVPILLLTLIFLSLFFCWPVYSFRVRFGADYLFQSRDESEQELIQTYDIIARKRVNPLYDLKIKFQFRSEKGDENEDRMQNLPSLLLNFGNRVVGLNLGISEDNIHETDRKYDLSREFITFTWRPYQLPKFTLQYHSEEKKLEYEDSDNERQIDKEKRLIFREDYGISLGIFHFDHSLTLEKKKVEDPNSGNPLYDIRDLHNRGGINYKISFLDSRLNIYSDYELSHHDKKNEELKNEYRSIEHKINVRLKGVPSRQVKVYYNVFWGDLKKWPDPERQTSLGNSLKTEVLPHKYIKTIFDVAHDTRRETKDDERNSLLTYGVRLEPKIPGLIFDPNIPMPPMNTSLLFTSSLHKTDGEPRYRSNSFLLKGSTELYKGFEIRTDLEFINKRNYDNDGGYDDRHEENFRIDASLDLRQDLQYYFRTENTWEEDAFDGKFWHLITYRPVDQFFLTLDHTIDYSYPKNDSSYSFRVGWAPVPKLRFEGKYQSNNEGAEETVSTKININLTKTLKFRLEYEYPSDDQVISFRFTFRT